MQFGIDTKRGEELEKYYLEYLLRTGREAWLNEEQLLQGKRKADIFVRTSTGVKRLQLKTQFAALYSGNVAIEEIAANHPYDYAVHIIPYAYWIPRSKELELLSIYPHHPIGDDNRPGILINEHSDDFKHFTLSPRYPRK